MGHRTRECRDLQTEAVGIEGLEVRNPEPGSVGGLKSREKREDRGRFWADEVYMQWAPMLIII